MARFGMQMEIWAATVRTLRQSPDAVSVQQIVLDAGKEAWGEEWDWSATDWGLQRAATPGKAPDQIGRESREPQSGGRYSVVSPHPPDTPAQTDDILSAQPRTPPRSVLEPTSFTDTVESPPAAVTPGDQRRTPSPAPAHSAVDDPGLQHGFDGNDGWDLDRINGGTSPPMWTSNSADCADVACGDAWQSGEKSTAQLSRSRSRRTISPTRHSIGHRTLESHQGGPTTLAPAHDSTDHSALIERIVHRSSLNTRDKSTFRLKCVRLLADYSGIDLSRTSALLSAWQWPQNARAVVEEYGSLQTMFVPTEPSSPEDEAELDEALALMPRFPGFSASLVSGSLISAWHDDLTIAELLRATSEADKRREYSVELMTGTLLWLEGIYRPTSASKPCTSLRLVPDILACSSNANTTTPPNAPALCLKTMKATHPDTKQHHVYVLSMQTGTGRHWMLGLASTTRQNAEGYGDTQQPLSLAMDGVRLIRQHLKTPGDIDRNAVNQVSRTPTALVGRTLTCTDEGSYPFKLFMHDHRIPT